MRYGWRVRVALPLLGSALSGTPKPAKDFRGPLIGSGNLIPEVIGDPHARRHAVSPIASRKPSARSA